MIREKCRVACCSLVVCRPSTRATAAPCKGRALVAPQCFAPNKWGMLCFEGHFALDTHCTMPPSTNAVTQRRLQSFGKTVDVHEPCAADSTDNKGDGVGAHERCMPRGGDVIVRLPFLLTHHAFLPCLPVDCFPLLPFGSAPAAPG